MIDFIALARRCLKPLSDSGFTFWEERLCRGEVRLKCHRGDLEIRVSYEPYGPPWCDVYRAERYERRLEIDSGSHSQPEFTDWFFQIHEQELEMWCSRLLRRLKDEKIVA